MDATVQIPFYNSLLVDFSESVRIERSSVHNRSNSGPVLKFVIGIILKSRVKEINHSLLRLIGSIKSNSINITHDKLVELHSKNKAILDTIHFTYEDIKSAPWYYYPIKNSLITLIETVKELEMASRIKAFPERNEIPLTYDELKELSEALQGWECASEQTDLFAAQS
jgi:hypothetical protein